MNRPCVVCGKADRDKPMTYRGEPWCCGLHEKIVQYKQVDDVERPALQTAG
jgi:hypothetical protein